MQEHTILTQALTGIRRIARRFSIDSLVMYAIAFASEIPVAFTRMLIMWVLASITLAVTGHSERSLGTWTELGAIPTVLSVIALLTPIGTGWWWKQRSGGRRPSERERLAYQDAIELLQTHASEPLPLPGSWFVLDTPTSDAAVCGSTLMLSRGLLESDHLPAVIAHELGHLATPDGRLTAALNRLVLYAPREREQQPEYERHTEIQLSNDRIMLGFLGVRALIWLVKKTVSFANGGLGLRLTRPLWGVYWRGREYTADAYAARLGQADELADFLEVHALIHDHPVPFIWLTEHTHPPSELRIDRLRDAAEHHQPGAWPGVATSLADRSEPVKGSPSGPPSAGLRPPLTEP